MAWVWAGRAPAVRRVDPGRVVVARFAWEWVFHVLTGEYPPGEVEVGGWRCKETIPEGGVYLCVYPSEGFSDAVVALLGCLQEEIVRLAGPSGRLADYARYAVLHEDKHGILAVVEDTGDYVCCFSEVNPRGYVSWRRELEEGIMLVWPTGQRPAAVVGFSVIVRHGETMVAHDDVRTQIRRGQGWAEWTEMPPFMMFYDNLRDFAGAAAGYPRLREFIESTVHAVEFAQLHEDLAVELEEARRTLQEHFPDLGYSSPSKVLDWIAAEGAWVERKGELLSAGAAANVFAGRLAEAVEKKIAEWPF